MKVYIADEKNINDIKEMWRYCFAESEAYNEYYFDRKLKPEDTVVCCDDEKAIASIQLNQYKIMLNEKEENVSYVVGVSTMPEARGKGIMKKMMKFSLDEMYKRGQNVSLLMPIDFRLYRRYGYENCYDILEHRIDMEELSGFRIEQNVRRLTLDDINELIKLYDSVNKMNNGYVIRDRFRFENMFAEAEADGSYIYGIEDESGKLSGYMVYSMDSGTLFVRELYFTDISTLKTAIGFIYNHNTQCSKAVIMEDIRNCVGKVIRNPRKTETIQKQFMMGRVINFDGVLDSMVSECNSGVNAEDSIKVAIKDDYIESNNAVYDIRASDDGITYEKFEYNEENSDVSMNINCISQLVFSYIDIDEADFVYNLGISDDKKEVLKRLFVKRRNHINEYD
ncbi:GNAT family N-acetyltransferase [Peptacetobacter hominis]|uniref:GNAT family N-acetyltransferase n=1 Tax=Peptacetobacter hominis TaxID=2743610 RepID=A0A544QY99_9FIRM|nr:GNAT family N-acetyltransferase [Peptacetobacter hominis]TQQ85709.1 GNAT family N-acetyltransferase [Peptacetobacter hominis]